MVVFRDRVRLEYFKPHLDIASIPVNAQWGMLALVSYGIRDRIGFAYRADGQGAA